MYLRNVGNNDRTNSLSSAITRREDRKQEEDMARRLGMSSAATKCRGSGYTYTVQREVDALL